jgi:hypothetical protein
MTDIVPASNLMPELPESNPLTVQEFRQQAAQNINQLRSGVFGALKDQNVDSLLPYLLVASAAPLIHAYSTAPAKIVNLSKLIWPTEYAIFARYLADVRFQPAQLAASIQTLLQADPFSSRIFEQLLIFAEVIPQLEEIFGHQEWVLQGLRRELQDLQRHGKFQQLQITIPSEQNTAPTTSRGDLQIQVSASKPTIVAGEEFSVFVVINNPFEVPVTLYSVETQIPVELVDIVGRQKRRLAVRAELEEERKLRNSRKDVSKGSDDTSNPIGRVLDIIGGSAITTAAKLLGELLDLIVNQWSLAVKMAALPESRIAQAVAASEIEDRGKKIDIRVQQQVRQLQGGGQVIGASIENYQTIAISIASASPKHLDSLLWRLDSFKRGLTPITLQPGDSLVKQFIFKTKRWLFFTPLAHTMQIQVRYNVDDRDHLDTVPFALTIQAAITATMVGAVMGGIAGGMARLLSDAQKSGSLNPSAQILSLSLGVILSAVTVVSFARKSGVQQIVSIEDFWGGLFLGFLIGFLGQNYALNLIAPNSANSVLPAPGPTATP